MKTEQIGLELDWVNQDWTGLQCMDRDSLDFYPGGSTAWDGRSDYTCAFIGGGWALGRVKAQSTLHQEADWSPCQGSSSDLD